MDLILWLGLFYSHVSKKETNFVNEQSSSDEYNHDVYNGDKRLKPTTQSQTSLSRIFGANQSSFRNNADDGLLCGVLLLPMVTASKMSDLLKSNDDQGYIAYVQARLELLFIMSVLLLILVFVNEHLRPLKRVIRKRGLLISSILVSLLFATLVTRLLPLTITLSKTPIWLTIVSIISFQWFLYICVVTLKRCFTLGEMTIISQSGAVLVYGTMEYIYIAYFPNSKPDYLKKEDVSPVSMLVHVLIIGMIFIGVITYPLLRESRKIAQKPYWRSNKTSFFKSKKLLFGSLFYLATIFVVVLILSPFCKAILKLDPFLWTIHFLYASPSRIFLCLYWFLMMVSTIIMWVLVLDFSTDDIVVSKSLTATLNIKRKVFHALAAAMFVPGVMFEYEFLQLAFGIALSAFIYLEYLRYFAVWPWGKNLHIFLTEFIDNRDLGPVILSHLYLLIGCASPVWIKSSSMLASLSGILALGFGDSAASIIGKKYGRYYWLNSKKTIEGTLAFVFSVLVSSFLILQLCYMFGIETSSYDIFSYIGWQKYSFVVLLTGLLEAFSSQNDNIILPLYMYSLIVML
ncbi:unnamed protein product [Rhizopus stolonifer]